MKIALGSDHAGYELKEKLKLYLAQQGIEINDQGTESAESVDYPDYARKVAREVSEKRAEYGVLVCGSGIGMAITANKVPGIRAANVCGEQEARLSREHNDANVIAIGARFVSEDVARAIVDKFLHTPFAKGRHARRVGKITMIEEETKASGK